MNIYHILTTLANNNSRNFKIEYLESLKSPGNDDLLLDVLFFALDPLTNFYIKKIPEYTRSTETNDLSWAISQLTDLSNRVYTGHAGIDHLRMILSSLSDDDAEVIKRIIAKDLKCGVSTATVNKVWKDFIPEFPVLLCSPFEQRLADKIQYPAVVQKKEDGTRFAAIIDGGTIELRSRNGKEFQLLDSLAKELLEYANGDQIVLDGELLVLGKDKKILPRKQGNGIINKSIKGTISKGEADSIICVLWDTIPLDDFYRRKCNKLYSERLETLLQYNFEYIQKKKDNPRISIVESAFVDSFEEAQQKFQDYLDKGFEGIILKDNRSIWEDGRSPLQLKFKAELELEAEVVEWYEGTGKYIGLLGALGCITKDKKGLIKFKVGSGFSDEQRKNFTKEYVQGKIITVKYNEVITEKSGERSLFLPVFIEERLDKDSIE